MGIIRTRMHNGYCTIFLPTFLYNPRELLAIRDELVGVLEELEYDEKVRVIVLTADESGNEGQNITLRDVFHNLADLPLERIRFSRIFQKIDVPVVAAIPMGARGLWAEMLLWCDIRIASDESCFSFPHVLEGLIPWDGATQKLPRIVGLPCALDLLMTGREVNAREAEKIGLVNRVVSKDKVLEESQKIAEELVRVAPNSLKFVKEAVYGGSEIPLTQGLKLEEDLYLLLFTTADRKEGIESFREKRIPHFSGK